MKHKQEMGSIAVHVFRFPLRINRGKVLAVPGDPTLMLEGKEAALNGFGASQRTAKAAIWRAESCMVAISWPNHALNCPAQMLWMI
jgi:hypothetical protein